ncbi:MAG: HAD family hydrolase [Candidatus Hodarchaeota archaeon]
MTSTKISTRAIIFDFDGTLADSMPFLADIGVQVMTKYYPVSNEEAAELYKSTTGLPYEHQIKINFPGKSQNDEAIDEFEKLKIERIFEQQLFPEVPNVLDRLSKMNLIIFVSSSTFQSTITEYFKRKKLLHYFADILGYRPGFEKGADHFNYVKQQHGIDLSEVVFIGDSLKDYERSRGFCTFIGLEGMFQKSDFRNHGHNGLVAENLNDIPDLIEPLS